MLYRKLNAVLIMACAFAGLAGETRAQDRYLEIAARYNRAQVYHQALVLPNGTAREAVITFRIPNSLLVFTQEKAGFEANVELTAEVYRGTRKVDEEVWRRRQNASTFEESRSRTDDLEGQIRFAVEPGDYTYRLVLNDGSGDDRGTARAFHVPDGGTALYGSLVFGTLHTDSIRIMADGANLGGDVPYGLDLPAIVPIEADPQTGEQEAVLTYQLYRLSSNRTDVRRRRTSPRRSSHSAPSVDVPEPIEIQPDDDLILSGAVTAGELVPVGGMTDADCLCWSTSAESGSPATLAVIPLKTNELENGTYVLQVTPAGREPKTYVFGTQWRDMPLSLFDATVAIRNLEFIEDRATIRELLKGSRDDQMDAFRAYWKKRDPTPGTVRNELMEEYYRRVDQAAVKFQTGQHPVPDGLRTDPARIYVLYGEPDEITSTLPSSGGVEQTWRYSDGRTFVFWAGSSLAPMELVE